MIAASSKIASIASKMLLPRASPCIIAPACIGGSLKSLPHRSFVSFSPVSQSADVVISSATPSTTSSSDTVSSASAEIRTVAESVSKLRHSGNTRSSFYEDTNLLMGGNSSNESRKNDVVFMNNGLSIKYVEEKRVQLF